MTNASEAVGIDMASLREAFEGSEEVLVQMLGLFNVQAAERMVLLDGHLAAWDAAAARTVLHSLVNIAGAVRAYGMSEQAKAVGLAVKAEDRPAALDAARLLRAETDTVLGQSRRLLAAAQGDPGAIWNAA